MKYRISEYPISTKFITNNKHRTTRPINNGNDNDNLLVYQIINGDHNASRQETILSGGVIRFTTNGIKTQVPDANQSIADATKYDQQVSDDPIIITYDGLGNHVTHSLLSSLVPNTLKMWRSLGKTIPSDIFNINTKDRHVINKVHKNQ